MLEWIINGHLRPSAMIGLLTTVATAFFVLVAVVTILINKIREKRRKDNASNESTR